MNEGYYKGQILSVTPIKNRFNKPGFELCFEVGIFGDDGKTPAAKEEVYLEVSDAYGQGNLSSQTQKQITFDTLKSIGFQHGEDVTKLPTLVNATVQIRCKNDNKGNNRFYFSNKRPNEKISFEEAAKMMAQIGGGAPAGGFFNAGTAAPAPAAHVAAQQAPNPFAGM